MKRVIIKKCKCLNDNITYSSNPDYDNWGFDTYWSCEDWITWHKELKKKYGSVKANNIWETAWNKQSFDEHNYSWCKYNISFNDYVKKEGLRGASHILANVSVNVVKGAENTSEVLTNVTSILKNKFVISLLLIGAGYVIYKKL